MREDRVFTPTRRRSVDQRPAGIARIDGRVGLDEERESGMSTSVRASAETMPLVTVWPTPNGLPMASTRSPTSRHGNRHSRASEEAALPHRSSAPRGRCARPSGLWRDRGGRSSATRNSSASATTWLLVTITPSGDDHPEPSERSSRSAARLKGSHHPRHRRSVRRTGRLRTAKLALLYYARRRVDVDHRRCDPFHDRREGKLDLGRRGRHHLLGGDGEAIEGRTIRQTAGKARMQLGA